MEEGDKVLLSNTGAQAQDNEKQNEAINARKRHAQKYRVEVRNREHMVTKIYGRAEQRRVHCTRER